MLHRFRRVQVTCSGIKNTYGGGTVGAAGWDCKIRSMGVTHLRSSSGADNLVASSCRCFTSLGTGHVCSWYSSDADGFFLLYGFLAYIIATAKTRPSQSVMTIHHSITHDNDHCSHHPSGLLREGAKGRMLS